MSTISESHYIRKAFKIDCISISNNDHIDTANQKKVLYVLPFKKRKKIGVILTNLHRVYKIKETKA